MSRGTAERPRSAMYIDDHRMRSVAGRYRDIRGESRLQRDRFVIRPDCRWVRVELHEVVGEPFSLLLYGTLSRVQVEVIPTANNVLFAFGQHRGGLP